MFRGNQIVIYRTLKITTDLAFFPKKKNTFQKFSKMLIGAFETEHPSTPTDDVFAYSEAEHAKSIIMVQGAHLIP